MYSLHFRFYFLVHLTNGTKRIAFMHIQSHSHAEISLAYQPEWEERGRERVNIFPLVCTSLSCNLNDLRTFRDKMTITNAHTFFSTRSFIDSFILSFVFENYRYRFRVMSLKGLYDQNDKSFQNKERQKKRPTQPK